MITNRKYFVGEERNGSLELHEVGKDDMRTLLNPDASLAVSKIPAVKRLRAQFDLDLRTAKRVFEVLDNLKHGAQVSFYNEVIRNDFGFMSEANCGDPDQPTMLVISHPKRQ